MSAGVAPPTNYLKIGISPNGAISASNVSNVFPNSQAGSTIAYFPPTCQPDSSAPGGGGCACSAVRQATGIVNATTSRAGAQSWSGEFSLPWSTIAPGDVGIDNKLSSNARTFRANFFRFTVKPHAPSVAACNDTVCD